MVWTFRKAAISFFLVGGVQNSLSFLQSGGLRRARATRVEFRHLWGPVAGTCHMGALWFKLSGSSCPPGSCLTGNDLLALGGLGGG